MIIREFNIPSVMYFVSIAQVMNNNPVLRGLSTLANKEGERGGGRETEASHTFECACVRAARRDLLLFGDDRRVILRYDNCFRYERRVAGSRLAPLVSTRFAFYVSARATSSDRQTPVQIEARITKTRISLSLSPPVSFSGLPGRYTCSAF